MKQQKAYMGIDQYGQHFHIGYEHPRKYLLEYLGKKHCSKMYVDKKDGSIKHVGYIISGLWIRLFEVIPFEKEF